MPEQARKRSIGMPEDAIIRMPANRSRVRSFVGFEIQFG
jgi:hypothetical protein